MELERIKLQKQSHSLEMDQSILIHVSPSILLFQRMKTFCSQKLLAGKNQILDSEDSRPFFLIFICVFL